eukprot:403374716
MVQSLNKHAISHNQRYNIKQQKNGITKSKLTCKAYRNVGKTPNLVNLCSQSKNKLTDCLNLTYQSSSASSENHSEFVHDKSRRIIDVDNLQQDNSSIFSNYDSSFSSPRKVRFHSDDTSEDSNHLNAQTDDKSEQTNFNLNIEALDQSQNQTLPSTRDKLNSVQNITINARDHNLSTYNQFDQNYSQQNYQQQQESIDNLEFESRQVTPRNLLNLSNSLQAPINQPSLSTQSFPNFQRENVHVYEVQSITYLPVSNLITSQKIENGVPVTLSSHISDILKHYDILPAPKNLLGNIQLPSEGRFFLIRPTPETENQWWSQKCVQNEQISQFVSQYTQN